MQRWGWGGELNPTITRCLGGGHLITRPGTNLTLCSDSGLECWPRVSPC